MIRTEKRIAIYCVRGSLVGLGLERIVDPSACGELEELARAATDAFVAADALLALAGQRLINEFAAEASTSNYLPSSLIIDREIQVVELSELESSSAPSAIARAANEATRQNCKSHHSMGLTIRLAAHQALRELGRAVQAAEPSADRDAADFVATELLELAERIGLGDDSPLARLWPRLGAHVVEVERVRHHASRAHDAP